jgi:hypothetical protein
LALHRTSAAPPAVAAKPAATMRSMSAPVRGSSVRPDARRPPARLPPGAKFRAPLPVAGPFTGCTAGDWGRFDGPGGPGVGW